MPVYMYVNLYDIPFEYMECWYKNNKCHRDGDLPAIEAAYGNKCWYKNGKRHRNGDLPAIEYASGTKWWYKNGKCHRDNDLPAIEQYNGIKKWFKNNERYSPLIYSITITINKIVIVIKITKIGDKWWYN